MIPEPFVHEQNWPDGLEEGFYLLTMHRSGRVSVPVAVWWGPPKDPATGDLLDRSPRWNFEVNGVDASDEAHPPAIAGRPLESLVGVWPECKAPPRGQRIDEAEYRYRTDRAAWAERHDELDPFGGTGARVDPLTATLPSWD